MEPQTAPNHTPLSPEFADDLLRGADKIATFISGRGQPAKGLLSRRMRAASRLQAGLGALRQQFHIDGVDFGAGESRSIQ
jgi:hypothetical protein